MITRLRLFLTCGLALLGCLLTIGAMAQAPSKTGAVQLTVTDRKNRQPIEFATAVLVMAKDSAFVAGKLTGKDGLCLFQGVVTGAYLVRISFVGYKSDWRMVKVVAGGLADAGTIALEVGITLNDVTIKGDPTAIIVKQDTTELNIAAFKAAPDATLEKGLAKLPGVDIDKDGNIKVNGQAVQKVLVDGKEFFADDPKVATKNLQYDAISKVQLIDDKSEQAKVSGIDDGKRSKVINVILKDDRKKGWFGNATTAGGTQERYLGSASVNRFTKEKQLNLLLLSNNINQVGYTTEDNNNFVGGVPTGSSNEGLTTTHSAGINVADEWGKKNQVKVTASYIYGIRANYTSNETESEQKQLGSVFFNTTRYTIDRTNTTHRVGLRLAWTVDSLTTVGLLSNNPISFYSSAITGSFSQSDISTGLMNDGTNMSHNKTNKYQSSGSLSVARKMRAKKGTVSLYVYWIYNPNDGGLTTQSHNTFYQGGKAPVLINRLEATDNTPRSTNGNFNFNRILGKNKKTTVFLSPTYSLGDGIAERNTLEYNPLNGLYELRLDSLSNRSYTRNLTMGVSAGLTRSFKKGSIYVGPGFNSINLAGYIRNSSSNERVSKNYLTFVPALSLTYSPAASKKFSLYVSGNSNTPAIADLLLKQNNTNPLSLREGNPDLRLTTNINGTFTYTISDAKKKTYSSAYLQFTKTTNAVSRNSQFDKITGITTSKPLNVDGNYSLYGSYSFAMPLKITGLRISPSLNIDNGRNYNFINGEKNRSDRIAGGTSVNFSYDRDKVNISLNSRVNYSYAANSLPSAGDNRFWLFEHTGSFSLSPVKKWRMTADISDRSYAGQNVVLINSGLQRYLAPNNRMTLEVQSFDLLNNNSELSRYISDTQTTTSRSNSLGQYFYLKLTYRASKTGGKS